MGSKLAVQMFTIRDFTKTAADLAKSLKACAQMGYTAVQMSAVGAMNGEAPEVSAKVARKMLDDNGLSCIATHRSWQNLMGHLDEEIAFHKCLRCDYVAIGGIPDDYERTVDGYRRWLADARAVIAALKAEGIRFGHHNHSHEFFRPERGGPTLEDVLIDEGGADLMMELDLYWITHAGLNCERILERCAGRVPVIHLKDKEILPGWNESTIAAIGEGTMDWAHIIPTCEKSGVDWYAIEQDTCQRDPFDCLRSSFDYLTGMGL
ncbi:MAG: sugar phosphate isomerase/epimerase [Planctomycetes bacterium]|nr:sugar phosphate isomerase/epimerase [Planctomycetota bacterium]